MLPVCSLAAAHQPQQRKDNSILPVGVYDSVTVDHCIMLAAQKQTHALSSEDTAA